MLFMTTLDDALATPDTGPSFDGKVRTRLMVGKDHSQELEILAVYFDAGARTRPHIHEKDQVLHFIAGKGIVATETERKICTIGDIVIIPGGTWHWHGATRGEAMCHISIRQPGTTNWTVGMKNWSEY